MSSRSQQETRLESHRREFLGAEVPMTGPLLRMEQLSLYERSIIEKDVTRRFLAGEQLGPMLYLDTLHSWGVMCPHPNSSRSYEGMYWSDEVPSFEECQWYVCSVCDCVVVNR